MATLVGTKEQLKSSHLRVPAGGWYQLQVRARKGEAVVDLADSGNFGVGDVFIVADSRMQPIPTSRNTK